MVIFLYESISGGGAWAAGGPAPAGSLLAEGRAMAAALAADFVALPEVSVVSTRDARLPPFHPEGCTIYTVDSAADDALQLSQRSAAADFTLLIAPETGGELLAKTRLAAASGGRLISSPADVVELASNKQATADWLAKQGIPVPSGHIVWPGNVHPCESASWVIKPLDGCGSQNIRWLAGRSDVKAALDSLSQPLRLEKFVPGLPASVAVLCGPAGLVALPACEQRLSRNGCFTYLGGKMPLPAELGQRARRLALAAVHTLPGPVGYLGVDLVLGAADDGSGDTVIEINPRLTTSYVGLRAACRANLAAAMLAVATGRPADIEFDPQPLEFLADGRVRRTKVGVLPHPPPAGGASP